MKNRIVDKVASLSLNFTRKNSKKEDNERKISQLKRQNDNLKNSNQRNIQKIQKLENERNRILYDREELKNAVNQYIPLMKAVFDCDELEGLLRTFSIDRSKDIYNISNLIGFVGLIGNGTTFADVLYRYLENNKMPLQKSIVMVAKTLNEFYIDKYDLDYNVVDIPDMDKRNYNKAIMKDFDRRTSIFKYYDEIYTPIIMRNREDVERLALVHGYN